MEIIKTSQYLRTKKQLIKKHVLSKLEIENTLDLFEEDPSHLSLNYKKMTCKKDKERYSIRIPGTQYRILMNVFSDTVYLICVCSHDEYDRRNKRC
jgi:mRNA-degrading endonuclease HigB of HigAB toxin-antitoxin module